MIKITIKKALLTWFLFSIGVIVLEIMRKGGDALIIDMITPAYWMFVMLIMLRVSSEKH